MRLTQALLPHLRAQPKAQVICLGSALGRIGLPGFSIYSASKFGLRGFAEALRRELRGTGIRVQYVGPRSTRTSFNDAAVQAYNAATGTAMDSRGRVAETMLRSLQDEAAERFIGFPERLAVRINGVVPTLLDGSFDKHRRSVPPPSADAACRHSDRTQPASRRRSNLLEHRDDPNDIVSRSRANAALLWVAALVVSLTFGGSGRRRGRLGSRAAARLGGDPLPVPRRRTRKEVSKRSRPRPHQVSEAFPGRSEPLIWEGIVVSSLAGEKGGLGALGLVKQAKSLYETAIQVDGTALDGSAYNSLGVLYYKVPGWPIGFGDKNKARELLQKALSINPRGIDPNFFYGEYLVETKRPEEAVPYLERALQAPARPGRQIADAGRREEARALLDRVKAK